MIDVVVTQRVQPGMEQAFEELARELTANTLAKDKGCLRYEWYRSETPRSRVASHRGQLIGIYRTSFAQPEFFAF